ncbi:3-deoxy-7-phosphoheptulonate synthase [Abyssisolibacter fermentans]|uniref:3-deoxy-7-phosphoheptulonate synthase n=1 Tax=Abyssisolibacter fermentans TaxID=1766203 RepID=UPI00082BF248|nr:3-deoxy-7-phosphoheptulonate synthase [Abyssisolibacter fermentans]
MEKRIIHSTHRKKVNIGLGDNQLAISQGGKPIIISGPCAIENEEMIFDIAKALKRIGCSVLRGGAFKPRTSPYSFQGLGIKGLKYLYAAGKKYDMPVVSEIMEEKYLTEAIEYLDIIQIGSRNMYNYPLLTAVGKTGKPILLKRGMSATIDEWILAAEYIAKTGNTNIIMCERGIRTFNTSTRNTLDLSAVTIIKQRTQLPVIVDPSHGTGDRSLIMPMSRAALACYSDGIMVEVHNNPSKAMSDGEQSLNLHEYEVLINNVQGISKLQI